MSTVPETREPREIPPEPGTVGALLRFIDQYSIPADSQLVGFHAEGWEYGLGTFEFRVTDTGEAKLVIT